MNKDFSIQAESKLKKWLLFISLGILHLFHVFLIVEGLEGAYYSSNE